MRVLIVSAGTFSSQTYRGFLNEIACQVDSLAVVIGEMPDLWSATAVPKDQDAQYRLHTIVPRFALSPATLVFPGLRKIILETHPNIVHLLAEPWQFLALQAVNAARSAGATPGIQFYENGPRMAGLGGSIRRAVGTVALRRCGYAVGMTSQSASVARRLAEAIDIEIIPPPLGIRSLRPLEDSGDADGWFGEGYKQRLRIAFVGRLVPEKGVSDLLRTCDALETDIPISVAVAGEGRLRPLVAEWAANKGYRVHDKLDRPAVLRLLSASDLLVMPSRTIPGWTEQFGRVAVEAMSQGTPVVGYDSGALREVIGNAGFVVREGDTGALESAIRAIALLPEEGRRELRERAHNRAAQFTDSVVADGLIRLWARQCDQC